MAKQKKWKKKHTNKLPKYYDKYESLHDVLSHRELDPRAMKWVNHYYRNRRKFEFTTTNEFNFNSEKNMRLLKVEANNLKQRAMKYLNKRMQK